MIEIVVGILAAILCIVLVGVIVWMFSEEETPPSPRIITEGEKAFMLQEEQEKEETKKILIPFLIENIKDHFSRNHILYLETIWNWIQDEFGDCQLAYYKKYQREINEVLCQELSMALERRPYTPRYFYITKNKKE